jgi:hypothetical protein
MSIMLDRILDAATDNLRFAKILVQMGLDPNNVTWDAIFNRLLEIFLHNITLANMFALVGAIFFVATLLTHTMVPLRVANMIGCAFFAIFGTLTGAVTIFFLYLLMIPINAYRLRQMLALVKNISIGNRGCRPGLPFVPQCVKSSTDPLCGPSPSPKATAGAQDLTCQPD